MAPPAELAKAPAAPAADAGSAKAKEAKNLKDAAEAKVAAKGTAVGKNATVKPDGPLPETRTAAQDADEKAAKHAKIAADNEKDMGSNAAIWAGSGAAPPITAGDTAAM